MRNNFYHVYVRFIFSQKVLPFSAEDKDMDVDSSENQNVTMSMKSDNQSNGSHCNLTTLSKRSCGSDDKKETIESKCGKVTSKPENTANVNIDKKSSTTSSDTISATIQLVPKPEFPFREASSSAVNDTYEQTSDTAIVIEPETSAIIEIKQEGPCNPLDPLYPYAANKLQVRDFSDIS